MAKLFFLNHNNKICYHINKQQNLMNYIYALSIHKCNYAQYYDLKLLKSVFKVMVGLAGWDMAAAEALAFAMAWACCLNLTAPSSLGFKLADMLITVLKWSGYRWPSSVSFSSDLSLKARQLAVALGAVDSSSRRETKMGTYNTTIVMPVVGIKRIMSVKTEWEISGVKLKNKHNIV